MNIGGVNDYSLLQNYRFPSVPATRPEDTKVAEKLPISDVRENPSVEYQIPTDAGIAAESVAVTSVNAAIEAPARKDAQLEDISLTFNLQEEFGFLGQDSDIRSLDMEQAISDMKKDQVLQQYQYFVGRSQNLLTENEDGRVFVKF